MTASVPLGPLRVVWDFDGTTALTQHLANRAFLEAAGITDVDPDTLNQWVKDGSTSVAEHLGVDWAAVMPRFFELMAQVPPEAKRPFEHLVAALGSTDANYMVSNGHREPLEEALRAHGLREHYIDILCIDDGFPRKPDAAMYRELRRRHGGLDLAIGDRWLDLDPARELGILTCAFQAPELEADFHIADYADFPLVALAVRCGPPPYAATGIPPVDEALAALAAGDEEEAFAIIHRGCPLMAQSRDPRFRAIAAAVDRRQGPRREDTP